MLAWMLRGRSKSAALKRGCRRSSLTPSGVGGWAGQGHLCQRSARTASAAIRIPVGINDAARRSTVRRYSARRSSAHRIARIPALDGARSEECSKHIIRQIRSWAQEPSFRSALARLGEGSCECGLLERMKQMKRMKRFEVMLADLGAALGPTYSKHLTVVGQFSSPCGGKTCGPCEI
jgi:hypothetical protein